MKKFIICLCLSLSMCGVAAAQTAADIELMKQALDNPTASNYRNKDAFLQTKNNANEPQLVLSGLFLVYKNFVSSQDHSVCGFYPSCSEYGLLSVKRYGIVHGVVKTLDRLQRCNGFSPQKYTYDPSRRLLIDQP